MSTVTNIEQAGRLLQIWGWVFTILMTIVLFTMLFPGIDVLDSMEKSAISFFGIFAVVGVLTINIGRTLKQGQSWIKIISLFLAFISLFLFPIGTVFGVLIIIYLFRGWNDVPKGI